MIPCHHLASLDSAQLSVGKQAVCEGQQNLDHLLSPPYLLLLLQPGLLLDVLQGGADSFLQGFLVLQLLLLQSCIDVDLFSDSLFGQFSIQLVDATVCMGDQGIQVVR